jgi:MFS family permease
VKIINRTVWLLSLVSLFADMASEMLYPVVPVYLKEIGFSVFLIGVLEGVAEFTAGISKGYFGRQSDVRGVRLPFIRWGYFLSALSKPMMALFTQPLWIFFSRTTDRLGKGLRTAPRDALLSQAATPQTKARVFGFHRSLDTMGAVLGPVVALVYLHFFPQQYRPLFYIAFVPGLVSVLLLLLLREKKASALTIKGESFFSFFKYWNRAAPEYKRLVVGLLFFALINSSDVFLLLKAKAVTGSDTITITVYIFYNLVYAAASYPLGALADAWGFKKVFVTGLLLFAVVYALFGFATSPVVIFTGFFIYGIYAAATESIAKAWITNMAHHTDTATAVGFYTSGQSVCSLLASALAGLLWSGISSTATFLVSAAAALVLLIYFLLQNNNRRTTIVSH